MVCGPSAAHGSARDLRYPAVAPVRMPINIKPTFKRTYLSPASTLIGAVSSPRPA